MLATLLPAVLTAGAVATLAAWVRVGPERTIELREPEDRKQAVADTRERPLVAEIDVFGDAATPAGPAAVGDWPQFRGPRRDGIAHDAPRLARSWPESGPPKLWTVELGEGHAGAAVRDDRVYVLDYLRDAEADALRCFSLADGNELWRLSYPVSIKRNHGMSRTVPAVSADYIVGFGPKCHVSLVQRRQSDAPPQADNSLSQPNAPPQDDNSLSEKNAGRAPSLNGVVLIDLTTRFGTTVPPWYAGQCPLIDDGRIILAPGGDALMVALDPSTGDVIWATPNPDGWKMTHSSIVPMDFAGRRTLVYCADDGVVGVDAATGELLWKTSEWRISIATCPSPVVIPDGRLFFSGGYNSGAMIMQLVERDGKIVPSVERRLGPREFGSTQHTPILHDGHLYGVREHDGQLVCLDLNGDVVWQSGREHRFGLGPYLIARQPDDAAALIFVLNDDGRLTLAEATPTGYNQLAAADVLDGHDAWAPMAMAGDRLIVRDLTSMVCLNVGDQ